MVKAHPVSNLQMRRKACSQDKTGDLMRRLKLLDCLIFSTLWSSTVYNVNLSLCDPACDWLSIEAYNAPKHGVAPAADYRLFLLGISQMMHKLL
jgi:hypothetical protein